MKQIIFIVSLFSLAGCDSATTLLADPGNWEFDASAENTAFESRQARLHQRDVDGNRHTILLQIEQDDAEKFRLSYLPARRQECSLSVVGMAVDADELWLDWTAKRVELPGSGSTFEMHHMIFSTTDGFLYNFERGDKLALKVAHRCGGAEFERVRVFEINGADEAMNWIRGVD